MLTIFELVLNDHIGGELANVNALHICLVIIMMIMMIIIIMIMMIVILIVIMRMIIIRITVPTFWNRVDHNHESSDQDLPSLTNHDS